MALLRFDPFREIDRIAEQVMTSSRVSRTMPMEAFRRGDLDADKLSADYNRGVLVMTIPIAEASKPRRITLTQQGDAAPDNGSTKADQASGQRPAATS